MREAGGGSLSPARQGLSDMGAWFFRRIAGAAVTDPMSGFFMIRREIVSRLAPRLSPDGFKILVDVILSAGGELKIVEIPYRFRKRNAGEFKLTPLVGIDFLGLVVHHATAGALPIRFVLFAMVGASGLVVHIVTLSAVLHWFGALTFDSGQLIATVVAMASNFILNNEITYRSYRYRGLGLIEGFAGFALGCSVGAIANIDIASWLYKRQSDLVGRRARWRALERRLELCGEHQSHLAAGSAPLNGGAPRIPEWERAWPGGQAWRRAPKVAIRTRVWLHSVPSHERPRGALDGGRPVRRPGLLRRFRRSRLQADLSGSSGTRGRRRRQCPHRRGRQGRLDGRAVAGARQGQHPTARARRRRRTSRSCWGCSDMWTGTTTIRRPSLN